MVSFLIVCPLVFIAGFIDAIAGGGGLITLPAYLIAGLPVHNAIATNKMSSCMGTVVSTAKYAINGYIDYKSAVFCALASLCGSFAGSNLALILSEKTFELIMIAVLPLTAFYVLKNKNLDSHNESYGTVKTIFICIIIAFMLGMYDGFYGPGTGTFLLICLTLFARIPFNMAAGTTKVINLTSNITALCVFLYNGKVFMPLGLVAGLFSIAGNYLGAQAFTKNGVKFARPVILIVLILFFAKIIWSKVTGA